MVRVKEGRIGRKRDLEGNGVKIGRDKETEKINRQKDKDREKAILREGGLEKER